MRSRFSLVALPLSLALVAACGDDDADDGADAGGDASADTGIDGSGDPGGPVPTPPENPDCDPLTPIECALPWPSNLYLAPDAARETGYTLTFGPTTLPANYKNIHVEPEPYRRMDGYGVSTSIVAHFANLDTAGMATDANIAPSLAEDAPVLLFADTPDGLVRWPYWVELDAWETNPALQVVYVRPAATLTETTRYIVAFRDLVTTDGTPIEPTADFAVLRDGRAANYPWLAPRAARFDDTIDDLAAAGVDTSSLVLAWDFVTASSEAMHGTMLQIRRDGLAAVGNDGPALEITDVQNFAEGESEYWAMRIEGTFRAPYFMKPDVVTDSTGTIEGSIFNRPSVEGGEVMQNGWRDATFWIGVPRTALDGTPHRLVQYGHGFFGAGDEAVREDDAFAKIAHDHNLIYYSASWTGMSEADFGNIQFAVFDFNNIPWLTDRIHQGLLEFLVLERAARARIPALAPLVEAGVVVDTDEVYFHGRSQGGIYGATFMALAQNIERGFLGVPGANFSMLAHRSDNFASFFVALAGAYRGRAKQAALMQAVQTLWDSTDPSSYYRHITAFPFEGDQPRHVVAAPGRGDSAVAPVTLEVIARSDAQIATMPPYDDIRLADVAKATYPHRGSAIVLYSFENPWAPVSDNRPAPDGPTNVHGAIDNLDHHNEQMGHFFRTGEVIDVCGGDGCTPD